MTHKDFTSTLALIKILSEKPMHDDHQERARLVRNWKQDCAKAKNQVKKD